MPKAQAPDRIKFENHNVEKQLIGIGEGSPRISWVIPAAEEGFSQTHYELEIVRGGKQQQFIVEGGEQLYVPWPDRPLQSGEIADVRVRVAQKQTWSDWSETYSVEAGLLDQSDWNARFITPQTLGKLDAPAPILFKTFHLSSVPEKARLYATSHGIYRAKVNGVVVGNDCFAPGWSSYHNRLKYQTYDISHLLNDGENTIEVMLGNGWYRGFLGYENKRALYGEKLALLAQIDIHLKGGQRSCITTDETWKAKNSHITSDDFYNGESVDFSLLDAKSQYIDAVCIDESASLSRLVAPDGPPVRVLEEISAKKIWQSPSGKTLVDFGQNLVGWVRLNVSGLSKGSRVVIKHAEVLENEELGIRPLRYAKATDSFIIGSQSDQVLEPVFTFHGFRYVEITGINDIELSQIVAVVAGSDLQRTGWFECSSPMLNQLHENVVWGMKGNFLEVPTDCPQRDERLGWTGDIQIFSPTANFLYSSAGFLTSWLKDVAVEQHEGGEVPHVVPSVSNQPFTWTPTAAWGDAAVMVPWVTYQRTGDKAVLSRQLESMKAWVDCVSSLAGADYLWTGGFQYGDWLDPSAPPEDPGRAAADPDVVATAHFARSSELLARSYEALGKNEDAAYYFEQAENVKSAFAKRYVTADGRILSDAQTVYSLAIEWGLLPSKEQGELAGNQLADLVRLSGFRIATGFIGTPIICSALTRSGHHDVAYRLLLQTQCPSWLYPVTMGATTIWERWDSMLPDGSINPGEMTSFNHYALGAVADWMHQKIAGLALKDNAYKTLEVKPVLNQHIHSAKARHLTPFGIAEVQWTREENTFNLFVTVPVGCKAEVYLPDHKEAISVSHGKHSWSTSLTLDKSDALPENATIRELMDHERLWKACCDAAVSTGVVKDDIESARKMARYLDFPIAMVGQAFSPIIHFPGVMDMRKKIVDILNVYDPDVID